MSANNVYVVKYNEERRQWLGWDVMAEASDDSGSLILNYSDAKYHADTRMELEKIMEENYTLSPEYGYTTDYLPKDGTPILYEE